MRDEVLIEVISHATVAKDAKVDNKEGEHGSLSELRVMSFPKPRSLRTRRLIKRMGYLAAFA